MSKLKKYLGLIILATVLIALDIYWKELFFTIFLVYGLLIKLLLSEFVTGKIKKVLATIIWAAFIITTGLTIYVNYYLPHGPSYPTGEYICQFDDRGPCAEKYIEDLRKVDIPNWAKFLRGSEGILLIFGLLIAGLTVSNKGDRN